MDKRIPVLVSRGIAAETSKRSLEKTFQGKFWFWLEKSESTSGLRWKVGMPAEARLRLFDFLRLINVIFSTTSWIFESSIRCLKTLLIFALVSAEHSIAAILEKCPDNFFQVPDKLLANLLEIFVLFINPGLYLSEVDLPLGLGVTFVAHDDNWDLLKYHA